MVIFNAAAAGLPIITTRIRAAADYLKEPDNCLWVEPRSPDLLAGKIDGGPQRGAIGRHRVLSDWLKLISLFQSSCPTVVANLGRCPRLTHFAPFGAGFRDGPFARYTYASSLRAQAKVLFTPRMK